MEKDSKSRDQRVGESKAFFTFFISWNNLSQTTKLNVNLDQRFTLTNDIEWGYFWTTRAYIPAIGFIKFAITASNFTRKRPFATF